MIYTSIWKDAKVNARIELKDIQIGMVLGMHTIGELQAYLKAKESRIIKNPKKHCIKKYNFKQLTGDWI